MVTARDIAEIDMVMNFGRLLSGESDYVEEEINTRKEIGYPCG